MLAYQLFAELFEYPTPSLAGRARACAEETETINPQAAAFMNLFCAGVEGMSLSRLEEIYTSTFDLKPNCYPYVGYHLFGESYKRGIFMARLNQEYNARGFAVGNELPDHLGVVLRFLALDGDTQFGTILLQEGLVPALDEMAGAFGERSNNPFEGLIRALLLVLRENAIEGVSHA
jgi:nitrate reductase delta subunit